MMATIILSHDVKDYAVWKPYFVGDKARRIQAGLEDIAFGTKSDDPKKVFMIFKGDPGIMEKMMNDPGLAEIMKKSGVISQPEVIILKS
jgi:hypothetical protein